MSAAASNNSLKKLFTELVNKLEQLPSEKLNPSILFKESQYERFRPYINAPKKYEIQDRKPSVKEIIFRKQKKQVLNKGEDFTEEKVQKYIRSLDNLSTDKIKNYYDVGEKLYKPAGYPNYYDRLLGEINGTNKETWFSAFRTVVFGK